MVPSTLDLAGLEAPLDDIWSRLQERSAALGHPLWDGLHYRLENLQAVRGGDPTLALSLIPYARVRALLELARTRPLETRQEPRNMNTGAVVRTREGLLAFGAKPGRGQSMVLDLVGGGLQEDELAVRSGPDLARNMLKELEEELNVPPDRVETIWPVGFALTERHSVILLFDVRLACSGEELHFRFSHRQDRELQDLVLCLPREAGARLQEASGHFPLLGPFL
jgi:8-oxo-dGTP pyrophosphatase MutT (NUDIX family)